MSATSKVFGLIEVLSIGIEVPSVGSIPIVDDMQKASIARLIDHLSSGKGSIDEYHLNVREALAPTLREQTKRQINWQAVTKAAAHTYYLQEQLGSRATLMDPVLLWRSFFDRMSRKYSDAHPIVPVEPKEYSSRIAGIYIRDMAG